MQRRLLGEKEVGAVERQIAVHLVRRHLVIAPDPVLAAGVHQNGRADDIGLQEDARVFNGTIHMALGGKVDHHVGMLLLEELVHRLPIANVRPDKTEIGLVHHVLERREIARVRELIEAHDAVIGILPEHVKDKVTADKPGPAGHDDRH